MVPVVRLAMLSLLLLSSCAAPPPSGPAQASDKPRADPAQDPAYTSAVQQLTKLNNETRELLERGRTDDAAAAITKGQSIQAQLLAANRLPLPAMEAVSDLDALYARMLLSNGHDGWARLFYQKNLARWKAWEPKTEASARRMKEAQAGIAECDRRLK